MDKGYFSDTAIRPLPSDLYQLREDLYYTWYAEGYLRRIKVPAGYIFDGASIPMLGTVITWVLPWFDTIHPMGAHAPATAFHDYIWNYRGRTPYGCYEVFSGDKWVDISHVPELWNKVKDGQVWTFETSNRLFGRHLKELGIGRNERNTMQWAVGTPIGKRNWLKGEIPDDARAA